jgi:hypothetical protein
MVAGIQKIGQILDNLLDDNVPLRTDGEVVDQIPDGDFNFIVTSGSGSRPISGLDLEDYRQVGKHDSGLKFRGLYYKNLWLLICQTS